MRQVSASLTARFSVRTAFVFLLALAMTAIAAGPSLAAKKRTAAVNPRFAAIVIDANTGKTLYSANAEAPRYPASLTKMMTLYLTFEALQSGKLNKSTPVPFSAQAAAEPPTKLGIRAGQSISVETAILSLVTKSANDSAAALGELLGGSKPGFARMMTTKARQLGMTGTVFRNANGLPDPDQHTTARDMAVLGIALREHFPQYYPYFSTRSFTFGKQRIGNHNRLLGRVKGVDGIKTGYTRASGFNLVSSVTDGNRSIVAVVMGGTSGGARDAQMAQLIKKYMPDASGRRGGGDLIAKTETPETPIQAIARAMLPKRNAPTPELLRRQHEEEVAVAEALPPKRPADPAPVVVEQGYAEPVPARMGDIDPVNTASVGPSGWAIQVASSPSEKEARAFLDKTSKQASGLLADASAFTVAFDKGGVTYYRARFGGFGSKNAAWNACDALKKKRIACYAIQQ